jgi:hypothetical protein
MMILVSLTGGSLARCLGTFCYSPVTALAVFGLIVLVSLPFAGNVAEFAHLSMRDSWLYEFDPYVSRVCHHNLCCVRFECAQQVL